MQAILKEEQIKISVEDTGIGISDLESHNLFNLFETIDTSGQMHGLGFKLHISNILAEQIGNRSISVKSYPGRGSKFSFFIDHNSEVIRSTGTPESLQEHTYPIHIPTFEINRNPNQNKPRVLIVDDNEFNRLVLAEFLNREGIEFDEAINGEAAVRIVEEMNRGYDGYRLVVMDCQMPVMDGWEATQQILRMAESGVIKNCPVILGYSAYCGYEEEYKSLSVGMSEFLVKPVSRQRFMSVMSKYLN